MGRAVARNESAWWWTAAVTVAVLLLVALVVQVHREPPEGANFAAAPTATPEAPDGYDPARIETPPFHARHGSQLVTSAEYAFVLNELGQGARYSPSTGWVLLPQLPPDFDGLSAVAENDQVVAVGLDCREPCENSRHGQVTIAHLRADADRWEVQRTSRRADVETYSTLGVGVAGGRFIFLVGPQLWAIVTEPLDHSVLDLPARDPWIVCAGGDDILVGYGRDERGTDDGSIIRAGAARVSVVPDGGRALAAPPLPADEAVWPFCSDRGIGLAAGSTTVVGDGERWHEVPGAPPRTPFADSAVAPGGAVVTRDGLVHLFLADHGWRSVTTEPLRRGNAAQVSATATSIVVYDPGDPESGEPRIQSVVVAPR